MAIFLTIIFISCNSGADKKQTHSSQVNIESIPSVVAKNDSLDAVVKSIVDISANDFF